MSNPSDLWRLLWAKTDRKQPERWHALPWHLIEVSAVAHQLWEHGVPLAQRRDFSAKLGVDEDLAGRWVGFIAAIHDVGKASIEFQQLVPVQRERIEHATDGAIILSQQLGDSLRHGLISAFVLRSILKTGYGIDRFVADRYAFLTGGHHGVLATKHNLGVAKERAKSQVGLGVWGEMRDSAVAWCAGAFAIPDPLPDSLRTTQLSYSDAIWLAGLISVADWLGSDEKIFHFRTDVPDDPIEALKIAADGAKTALGQSGWYLTPLEIPSASFEETIRNGFPPYESQTVALQAVGSMNSPGITIVEYPMGWGKTEIALWIAAHWANTAEMQGFYVAMPTMATSDQLHNRVKAHLTSHLGDRKERVNLQLLHGQAALSVDQFDPTDHEDIKATDVADGVSSNGERGMHDRVQRSTWFTKRKRGLLATYGVGTVDQSMLAVLQTKHFFVRLHGLAGKTVIFDEVHSYDMYMSTNFDEVLRWLGAMGSPVVILTATLPSYRTRQLAAAYAEGAGWAQATGDIATYPRITTRDRDQLRSDSAPIQDDQRRTIALRRFPLDVEDDSEIWPHLMPELQVRLRDGGTVAVICNTVAQSQTAFKAFDAVFPGEVELFHARFRQMDRAVIQERVLRDFGKKTHDDQGKRIRPPRRIVVATQVIEQSLDIDVDLMISMFCPTDLLLQRSGRLQRHAKTDSLRPESLRQPELWVIGYAESEAGPRFLRGSVVIYEDHLLLRSWLALRGQTTLRIPDEVEQLIEATYGDKPSDLPEALDARWEITAEKFERKRHEDSETAKRVQIPSLSFDQPSVGKDALLAMDSNRQEVDDNPELHSDALARTRLGPPNISVVLLKEEEVATLTIEFGDKQSNRERNEITRELLRRSATLSDRRTFDVLRALPTPSSWSDNPFLRNHRRIYLDAGNRVQLGDRRRLELSDRLGVVFGDLNAIAEEEA